MQCSHIFCAECLLNHAHSEYTGGRILPRCFECREPLVGYEPHVPYDDEGSDHEGSASNLSGMTIFSGHRLGQDRFKKHPKLPKSQSIFLTQCDKAHPDPVVPSAKTTAVKATILEWQSQAPDDKIIVFVEFKLTGAVLGRVLEAEGIQFLYFFGDMDSIEKEQAIRAFHERDEVKVLVSY